MRTAQIGSCVCAVPGARYANVAEAILKLNVPGDVVRRRAVIRSYARGSIARIILHSERAGSGAPTPDPRVAGPGRRRRNRELMRRFHAATVHAAQLTKPNRTNRPRTQSASRVPPRVAYAACSLDRSMHHVHAAACSFGLGMHHVHAALVQLLHPCARRVARTTA